MHVIRKNGTKISDIISGISPNLQYYVESSQEVQDVMVEVGNVATDIREQIIVKAKQIQQHLQKKWLTPNTGIGYAMCIEIHRIQLTS